MKKIILKEGQKVLDKEGNEYILEKGDILMGGDVLSFSRYWKATPKELTSALKFLSSLSLKDLRRRQDIAEKEASKGKGDEDYVENEIKQRVLQAAVDIREFGDTSIKEWVLAIVEERDYMIRDYNLQESKVEEGRKSVGAYVWKDKMSTPFEVLATYKGIGNNTVGKYETFSQAIDIAEDYDDAVIVHSVSNQTIYSNGKVLDKSYLKESKITESKVIEIFNFDDLLKLPKNKPFSVTESVWFGGTGKHSFHKEEVYKVVKSTPTKISIQDSEGATYFFYDLENIYDMDTAKPIDSFYVELL